MKRPRLVMTMHPSGKYVSRTVPASYDGAVGVSIRTHPGTYDAELISVTVGAGGHVGISIRDPLGNRALVFFGHITDDGLSVRRGGR